MTVPRSPSVSTSCRRMACGMVPLAIAVAVAVAPAAFAAAASLCHVGQQRELTGALDGAGDLALVAAAGSRDAPRADLPAVGDESPQRGDVLVVNLLDLLAAVRAWLAPRRSRRAL